MTDSFSQTEEDKRSMATALGHSKKLEAVKEWLDEHKKGRWSACDLYSLIRLIEAAPSLTVGASSLAGARTELVGNAGAAGQLSALRERVIASLTQYIHQERVRLSGVYSSAFGAKDVKPEEVAKYNNQTTAALANAIELIKVEFRDAPLAAPACEAPPLTLEAMIANSTVIQARMNEHANSLADYFAKAGDFDWIEYHRERVRALAASVPPPRS